MHFTSSAALVALAQTSSVLAATTTVTLGQNNNLKFIPSMAYLNVGDSLVFTFLNANHSVVSGAVNAACVADNKFNSGYMPVNKNTPTPNSGATPPKIGGGNNGGNGGSRGGKGGKGLFGLRGVNRVFDLTERQGNAVTFTVQMTQPGTTAFYCPQTAHCQNGMFMIVNVGGGAGGAGGGNTNLKTLLQTYQQQAAKVKKNGQSTAAPGTGGTLSAAAQTAQAKNVGNGGGNGGGNKGGNGGTAKSALPLGSLLGTLGKAA